MKRLLNAQEAIEILNCSRTTLYRIIKSGGITVVKIRGSVRIEASSLSDYIKSHSIGRELVQPETAGNIQQQAI